MSIVFTKTNKNSAALWISQKEIDEEEVEKQYFETKNKYMELLEAIKKKEDDGIEIDIVEYFNLSQKLISLSMRKMSILYENNLTEISKNSESERKLYEKIGELEKECVEKDNKIFALEELLKVSNDKLMQTLILVKETEIKVKSEMEEYYSDMV